VNRDKLSANDLTKAWKAFLNNGIFCETFLSRNALATGFIGQCEMILKDHPVFTRRYLQIGTAFGYTIVKTFAAHSMTEADTGCVATYQVGTRRHAEVSGAGADFCSGDTLFLS
jgi:hypothetical protein